jgi:late competence protein required for DNA uptake (superfamily II DNA/RNA helicase)
MNKYEKHMKCQRSNSEALRKAKHVSVSTKILYCGECAAALWQIYVSNDHDLSYFANPHFSYILDTAYENAHRTPEPPTCGC